MTWSVHKPPSLELRLVQRKRLKGRNFGDLRGLARWRSYCSLIGHFTNPLDHTTRGLINDHYSLPFALLATFDTLKHFVPLHCFNIFFLTSNFRNASANASTPSISIFDGDQDQENIEANQQDQEEVETQIEDAHGGQSPPQRLTRSMFKALGARGHLFSLFVISLVEGA